MRNSFSILVFLVLGALQFLGARQGMGQSSPIVLFSVKGKPVYTDEFSYLFKKNHLKPEDATVEKIEEYLRLLINFKLKVTEATAQGLDTTAAFRKEFLSYKNELKKPYVAGKDVLDRLTREAYQRLTEEIKASHILVTCQPSASPADTLKAFNKILSLRSEIITGASFEKIAKEFSEDPSAKTNEGNLGYYTALQLVYPFEQAIYRLKVGELSAPVRTRFGYHLIKVTDRKPARGEVEVSHILLRANSDNAKAKNKIFEIYDQLVGGQGWEELCKEYSDDPATKESGGRLRPFGVGAMAPIPEFELVAFSLKEPGEISDPFQSAYGWHIVRLERKIPLPSYAEVEPSLRRKVSRDERLTVNMHRLLEEEKVKHGYKEESNSWAEVVGFFDSTLLRGTWKFKGDPALKTKTLITLDGRAFSAGAFITFIEKNQKPGTLAIDQAARQLLDRFTEETINDLEDEKLMAKEPAYRNLVNEYREGILLFTVMEKEVWNKASDDSTGQRQFYEKNREKYKAGDRVRARVFSSTDKQFLEDVKRRTAAGDTIKAADQKKFKSIQPARNYEKKESSVLDNVPWVIGLHEAEVNGNHYLVEIESLLPPGLKQFDEARAQIISDYQDQLEKEWLVRLKEKYPVKVNTKGRKYVISELTKK